MLDFPVGEAQKEGTGLVLEVPDPAHTKGLQDSVLTLEAVPSSGPPRGATYLGWW